MAEPIYGIPCSIEDHIVRHTIEGVLWQIERAKPADMVRLRSRIRLVEYLPPEEEDTTGEAWNGKAARIDGIWQAAGLESQFAFRDAPGTIRFSRRIAESSVEWRWLVVAHEFGHAATRQTDLERRMAEWNPWAFEQSATRYLSSWGFENKHLVACERAESYRLHTGGVPGDILVIEFKGPAPRMRFKVGPHYTFAPISTEGWQSSIYCLDKDNIQRVYFQPKGTRMQRAVRRPWARKQRTVKV